MSMAKDTQWFSQGEVTVEGSITIDVDLQTYANLLRQEVEGEIVGGPNDGRAVRYRPQP